MATVIVEEVVSVSNIENELLYVVPNPNRGNFQIQYHGDIQAGQIQIYSVEGKRVGFTFEASNESVYIRLNRSISGVYFVKANSIIVLIIDFRIILFFL